MGRKQKAIAAPKNASEDRFSELPDPIIHHIFSLLPSKDYFPMSSLSKRFNSAERSCPYIILDGDTLNSPKHPKHLKRLLATAVESITARDRTVNIEKFLLRVTLPNANSNVYVDNLVQFAFRNCIGEVDLKVDEWEINYEYRNIYLLQMPTSLLSSKSLTTLKLNGFSVQVPQTLFRTCPRLKELSIVRCELPSFFIVSSDVLKHLVLRGNYQSSDNGPRPTLIIKSKSLETFLLDDPWQFLPLRQVNVESCKSLRELVLYNLINVDKLFGEQIAKLDALKILTLDGCNCQSRLVQLSSSTVKHMTIKRMTHGHLTIDAPKLESLEYECWDSCYDLKITACRNLKSLKLKGMWMAKAWLQQILTELDMLNDLELEHSSPDRVDISHGRLSSLQLHDRYSPMLSSIDTPVLENLYISIKDGPLMLSPWMQLIGSHALHVLVCLPEKGYVGNYLKLSLHCKELSVFSKNYKILREFMNTFRCRRKQFKVSRIIQASSQEKIRTGLFKNLDNVYYFTLQNMWWRI